VVLRVKECRAKRSPKEEFRENEGEKLEKIDHGAPVVRAPAWACVVYRERKENLIGGEPSGN